MKLVNKKIMDAIDAYDDAWTENCQLVSEYTQSFNREIGDVIMELVSKLRER